MAQSKNANVTLRRATGADLPAIKQMAREFVDYLNRIDEPEAVDPAIFDRIENLAFGPDSLCTIDLAEIDGTPVGYLIWFIGVETNGFTPALHIADLYVRDAWRERGIGRIFMERAASILRERGGTTLFWVVWNQNRTAIEFYRRLGAEIWDEAILMRWNPGDGR
jgi:ribosomal protein S18 acetylase RimI-like enzyme